MINQEYFLKFIQSKDMQKFYIENNISLDERLIYAILSNNYKISKKSKKEAFIKLKSITTDLDLINDIDYDLGNKKLDYNEIHYKWYDIIHPFKIGDLVIDLNNKYALEERMMITGFGSRIYDKDGNPHGDWSDNGILSITIKKDGTVYSNHQISYFDIEYDNRPIEEGEYGTSDGFVMEMIYYLRDIMIDHKYYRIGQMFEALDALKN